MSRVVLDITTSLDGYVTGPDDDVGNGLGTGGAALHDWVFAKRTAADQEVLERAVARTGAVVMGRRLFDVVDAPSGWSDDVAYGAHVGRDEPHPPVVVVTSTAPERVRLTDRFTFVTTGIADAVARARELAGERDVVVMGGARTIASCLEAGIGDELVLHVAPVLLGDGRLLLPRGSGAVAALELREVIGTPGAAHVTYALG